jgi:hypothetical protein
MYNKIVAFTTDQLSPLTDITSRTLKGAHYEILVDCLWVDVVERINKECSSIFAPGMPDIFHKVRIPDLEAALQVTTLSSRLLTYRYALLELRDYS